MENRKMKILLFAPFSGYAGGIARWTHHIITYYEKCGENDVNIELLDSGRSSFVNINDSIFFKIRTGIRDYWKIGGNYSRTIKVFNPNILHLTSSASLSLFKDLFIIRKAHKNGIKTLIHFRFGRIPELYKGNNWERKMLDKVIKTADKVVVIDQMSFDTLKNQGYNHISLLPNMLSPEVGDYINSNMGCARKDREVLFVGQVIKTKGVFELVEACKSVPNKKLRIVGHIDPGMKSELFTLAGENAETWIEISGEQSYQDTIKAMMECAVFVLPTYTEGFPNVILESMACGCPIVTTPVGAIPEMLDIANGMECGICVKPKDVEGLKQAIIKMLDEPEYANSCGLNAQRRVNNLYSLPQVWSQLISIWENTI